MKKIITLVLALCTLAALCLFTVSCSGEVVPEGMQDVTAEGESYHLYVPASWQPQHNSGISGARYGNQDKANVTVVRYSKDVLGENSDPEAYWSNQLKPAYLAQDSEMKLHDEGVDETMGGRTGKRFVYEITLGKVTYKQMQVLIKAQNGDLFVFTYIATPDNYDAHMEEVKQILANFRF